MGLVFGTARALIGEKECVPATTILIFPLGNYLCIESEIVERQNGDPKHICAVVTLEDIDSDDSIVPFSLNGRTFDPEDAITDIAVISEQCVPFDRAPVVLTDVVQAGFWGPNLFAYADKVAYWFDEDFVAASVVGDINWGFLGITSPM
eukprot:CAMPEP_0183310228 /NCGR_PEP_ID=MMETSP0160_2-20130417/30227_1 /TAXON_ID=2839 ORGANISM="Odontella Sinensis, Strain Grunow 1884" /NCGR_SAMPLE_ID=MMETSP0160_2 /ASSEMBLY_ACC=CAM_ASM_000250 /LENGTH=148 /DNA_ID=CAMNT_0025474435 /DNA_START=107 /DNA_END=553 /DNA_ORIENTATION=-